MMVWKQFELAKELFHMLKQDRLTSVFCQQLTLLEILKYLRREVDEAIEEVEKNPMDTNAVLYELGDILWDTFLVCIIAEEKNIANLGSASDAAYAKLRRRKPWVFRGERLTLEEERRRYFELKAQEKKA